MTTTSIQNKMVATGDVNSFPKLRVINFQHVNAFTDVSTNELFLSSSLSGNILSEVIADEFAHLISGSADHNDKWRSAYKSLGGRSDVSVEFDISRRRYGISKNIGGNVGNVTGIQN